MDREAWRAAILGVTKSRTRLSDWTELNWFCIIYFEGLPLLLQAVRLGLDHLNPMSWFEAGSLWVLFYSHLSFAVNIVIFLNHSYTHLSKDLACLLCVLLYSSRVKNRTFLRRNLQHLGGYILSGLHFSGFFILLSTSKWVSTKHLFLLITYTHKNFPLFPSAQKISLFVLFPAGRIYEGLPYIFLRVITKSLTLCLIWIYPEAIFNWQ